jgi:hypothetical protein
MKNYLSSLVAVAAVCSFNSPALSQEAAFLAAVSGSWTGSGTVKVRTDSSPIKVTCNFESGSTEATLKLDGDCRGMVILSRAISADLKIADGKYSGSYVGAGTGTAGLSGKRSGEKINLGIKWAKEVNGDRTANMTIERVGSDGMSLTTVDKDPATGESVVTSRIDLRRK